MLFSRRACPCSQGRSPAVRSGRFVTRPLQRLSKLDAVLRFEVAAREIVGAGEGNERGLSRGVKAADRGAQRRSKRPVRIERERRRRILPYGLRNGDVRSGFVVERARDGDDDVRAVVAAAQEHEQEARSGGGRRECDAPRGETYRGTAAGDQDFTTVHGAPSVCDNKLIGS